MTEVASTVSEQAPRAGSKGVLKIMVGKCMTTSNKRFFADLHKIARALNRAKNIMSRSWLRYVEEHQIFDRMAPPTIDIDGEQKSFQMWLYRQAQQFTATPEGELPIHHTAVSPMLSACAKEVIKDLSSEVSSRHQGKARYKWQGIHYGEINLSTRNRQLSIPVPNNVAPLSWNIREDEGVILGVTPAYKLASRKMQADLLRYGREECVLAVPLFSTQAGRERLYHLARLNVKHLPDGIKSVLLKIIRGEWKYSDSSLVWKDVLPNSIEARKGYKGRWWFHLVYTQPAGEQVLNRDRVAVLTLNEPNAAEPFTISFGDKIAWRVGRGNMIRHLFGRLEARRHGLQDAIKVRGSGRRGHGRERLFRDMKPMTRYANNLKNDVACKVAAEIVRFCVRHDCGSLDWRAPGAAYRLNCWFPRNEVPWDWTLFEHRLSHEAWQGGVEVLKPKAGKRKAQ